jgi:hypothetical protein
MKTDAEIAKQQAQPPSATPEQIRANAELQVAQLKANAMTAIAQAKVQGEKDYAAIEQQTAAQDAAARDREANDKMQLATMQYLHEQKMKAADLQADAQKTNEITSAQRDIKSAELQVRASEAHKDRQHEANLAAHQVMLQPPAQQIPNQP